MSKSDTSPQPVEDESVPIPENLPPRPPRRRLRFRRWLWLGLLGWLILAGVGYWAGTQGLLPIFGNFGFAGETNDVAGQEFAPEGFNPDEADLEGLNLDGATFVDGEMGPDGMMGSGVVPIQSADTFIPDVVASGKLALSNISELVSPVDATVLSVPQSLGDSVAQGDALVSLDTTQLSATLEKQLLELNKARQTLAKLFAEDTQADLLTANAELLTAQEALQKLEQGPERSDLNDAQLKIKETQSALQKLEAKNDPNSQEVREARFSLSEAKNGYERALQSYEAISWKGDLAASAEAEALKNATIGLERTQLAYDKATAPPDPVDLESAQLAVSRARAEYDKLLEPPTEAEIEQAKAQVSKAQQALEELKAGPTPLEVQESEAAVMDSLTQFEETRLQLLKVEQLTAPIDGTIVKSPLKAGQLIKQGDTIVAIAAESRFKIDVSVNELFILNILEEMDVNIVIDVLPEEVISGKVSRIAPTEIEDSGNGSGSTAGSDNSLTSFPITVELLDSPLLEKLRAGMSAEVTFIGSNQLEANSWLVPLNAIEDETPDTATIQRIRDGVTEPIEVKLTSQTQGEWRVVVSPEIEEGDMVVGSTTSFLNESGPPEIFR